MMPRSPVERGIIVFRTGFCPAPCREGSA